MSERALSVSLLLLGTLLASSADAQNMALTPPVEPTTGRESGVLETKARPESTGRVQQHVSSGELPNQRTGGTKQRVVRDICIGCDR